MDNPCSRSKDVVKADFVVVVDKVDVDDNADGVNDKAEIVAGELDEEDEEDFDADFVNCCLRVSSSSSAPCRLHEVRRECEEVRGRTERGPSC